MPHPKGAAFLLHNNELGTILRSGFHIEGR